MENMTSQNMTPTQALSELNKIKEKHEYIKSEMIKLIELDNKIKNQINEYLNEFEKLEENYVKLMDVLSNK
jgi:archaellum component FlaC